MVDRPSERRRDDVAARLELGARRRLVGLAEHEVVDGMGADGDQRICRELPDLVPGHAERVADRRHIDAIACRQGVDEAMNVGLLGQSAQPPIDRLVDLALLRRAGASVAALPAIERHDDAVVVGDHRLQGEPPQLAAAIGKAGRDVDGERRLVRLEDRIGPHLVVAIAVVEGDAGEAAAEIAVP